MARTKEERHEYYLNHKDRERKMNLKWIENNLTKYRDCVKQWHKDHPEKIKKYRRLQKRKIRLEIIQFLGGKCAVCGETDWRCLQIDHTYGGGRKERLKFPSQHQYYKHILNQLKAGSKDYQLLCANHNMIKRFEKEEGFIK